MHRDFESTNSMNLNSSINKQSTKVSSTTNLIVNLVSDFSDRKLLVTSKRRRRSERQQKFEFSSKKIQQLMMKLTVKQNEIKILIIKILEFTNVSVQHQNKNSSFETKNFFESTTSFVSNSFINSSIISDLFQSVQNTNSKSEFVRIESRNLSQTRPFLLKKKRSIIKTLRQIRRLNEKKDHLFFMIESKFNSAKNNENLWKKIKKMNES